MENNSQIKIMLKYIEELYDNSIDYDGGGLEEIYKCPSCNICKIFRDFNYCPICGKKIIWISKKK